MGFCRFVTPQLRGMQSEKDSPPFVKEVASRILKEMRPGSNGSGSGRTSPAEEATSNFWSSLPMHLSRVVQFDEKFKTDPDHINCTERNAAKDKMKAAVNSSFGIDGSKGKAP